MALVCGDPSGKLKPLLGTSVELLTPVSPIKRSRYSRIAVAAFAARMARSVAADVIFLPGNFYVGMAPSLKLRLGHRCPAIVSKFSNMLRQPGRGRARQAGFETVLALKTAFSDQLVVMSPELLDEARRTLPWRSDRYSVIAQPVLDERSAQVGQTPVAASDAAPLLVAAGRLIGQKNFAGLIDAVALLDRPFRLAIHGEGPERANLESKIASLGLSDMITLPGYAHDLDAILAGARLFVLSSDYEGFPSVVVEALAAGVPIVATECSPAIASIIQREDAGRLVPVCDPATLSGAIAACLDRPPPRRSDLAKSVDHFRIGPSATAYLDLFRRVAVRAREGAPR